MKDWGWAQGPGDGGAGGGLAEDEVRHCQGCGESHQGEGFNKKDPNYGLWHPPPIDMDNVMGSAGITMLTYF